MKNKRNITVEMMNPVFNGYFDAVRSSTLTGHRSATTCQRRRPDSVAHVIKKIIINK